MTRRLRLRQLLTSREDGWPLHEISELFEVQRGVILADLKHLQLSLRHTSEKLLMAPASCKHCGFTCDADEPRAPSRCPMCKARPLVDPAFKIVVVSVAERRRAYA